MSKSQETIDRAFLRYQETGIPENLAEVFDGTSAQLLQLAHHLTPDLNTAEDLLQATFLVAIEDRHKFSGKAHVSSWLSGILVNLARVRLRVSKPMPGLESAGSIADSKQENPYQALAAKEVSKAVMEAIENLSEQYHPVLIMHLRHGFSPNEIAISLHRPVGTIRKQLFRGMGMLRKSLPASIIAGSAILTTPAIGLGAMRTAVLSKATAVAAQTAAKSSLLGLGKLGLWGSAGVLAAAALTLAILPSDVGHTTLPEYSPKALVPVAAAGDGVGFSTTASVQLQTVKSSMPLPVVTAISDPDPVFTNKEIVLNHNESFVSSPTVRGLGLPGLLLGAMALLPSLGQGQSVIYQHVGAALTDLQGSHVGDVGDLDFDGAGDYLVSSILHDVDPDGTPATGDEKSNAGRVTLFSGASGTVIFHVDGEKANDNFGNAVGSVGDLNLDGVGDFVTCATGFDADPDGSPGSGDEIVNAGSVYAISGSDGSKIWVYEGDQKNVRLGDAVCGVGDVNGDGLDDVAAGRWTYDSDPLGPDGTLKTGDETGVDDGRVWMLSGKDGSVLWTRDGKGTYMLPAFGTFFANSNKLGRDVGCAGDTNLDGYPDVVAGADGWDADPVGPDGTVFSADDSRSNGRMYLLSGDTGATLATFAGDVGGMLLGPPFGASELGDRFGTSVSGAGDVDLDGYPDFMGGSSSATYDPDGTLGNADDVGGVGEVKVFSGASHALIHLFDGSLGDNAQPGAAMGLVGALANAGDVNGDGTPDIVIGSNLWDLDPDGTFGNGDDVPNVGRAWVYSGKSGSLLLSQVGGLPGNTFYASAVSGAGDVNGDGYGEIMIGETGYLSQTGRAIVISGTPLSLTADTNTLSVTVANSQTMTIDAGVANAGKNYWLFTGFAAFGDSPGVTMAPGVVIPLNQPDPLTSFVIDLTQLGGGAPTFVGWKSTLDGAGKATPSLNTFGPVPVAVGVTLHHAALVYTADGCGVGCDTFQLATNWVPMTTTP